MNRISLAVALTVATFSTGAFAQSNEEQQACMNDAFRVCSATIPDRNRTIACMVQNKPQLSAACQMVMDKYAQPTTATAYAAPAPVAAPVRTVRNGVSPISVEARRSDGFAATSSRDGRGRA